jgi:iron complex transport system permease protein
VTDVSAPATLPARWVALFCWSSALVVVLGLLGVLALLLGTPRLSFIELGDILTGGSGERVTHIVVWELRMPRLVLGVASGAALGLAGVLLQDGLQNPLAGPELLGVSAGAAVVVATITIFRLPIRFQVVPWLACGGGLIGGLLVLLAARQVQDTVRLILVGAAVSALLNALLITVISLGTQNEVSLLFLFLLGSLANRTWAQVQVIAPWALIGIPLALGCARPLNVLRLGDTVAAGLGLAVVRTRLLLLLLAVALVAAVVAVAGPIGWIALLAPHLARRILGTPDARQVLPFAALLGAALLVAADLLARLALAPAELPVGVWTALLGGPVLLVLLRRQL